MNYPKIFIIILNWNRFKDIAECLESVRKTDYPNYDIIVVDNASVDGSVEKVKELFPEIILIKNNENLGFAGGNNVGMKYAINNGADYVWLLNNDTVVTKDTLTNLILTGERIPDVGLLSPMIYDSIRKDVVQYYGSLLDRRKFVQKKINDIKRFSLLDRNDSYLWGTALLIKRKVIEAIGYLNEDLFAYWEDADYSIRALKTGFYNKIEPKAIIFHRHHAGDNGDRQMPFHYYYYMKRNEYIFWKSQLSGFRRIKFLQKYISSFFGEIAWHKENGLINARDGCIEGFFAALLGIKGRWDGKKRAPRLLKSIILWHPCFLADLIDLKFAAIAKTLLERSSRRLFYAKS